MKKSRVVLAVVLAVILVIVCVNAPTFSWFTRPKDGGSGEKLMLQTKNTYTAYNGKDVTISTKSSTTGVAEPDSYTLTNPDPAPDYQARLTIRVVPVNRSYSKSELTKEIRGMLDTIKSDGMKSFSPSNTANRSFLGSDGIYANYSGTNADGIQVAGRVIASCVDRSLYILHVSYPKGYTDTYVDGVFNKFRNTVKMN